RDGWRHLYLFDGQDGSVRSQLTSGDWLVREVLHVDEKRRRVLFTASGLDSGRDPYYRHVFQVDLSGEKLERLSQLDADHAASVSPDGRYLTVVASRLDLAPVMELRDLKAGSSFEIERADISRLQ